MQEEEEAEEGDRRGEREGRSRKTAPVRYRCLFKSSTVHCQTAPADFGKCAKKRLSLNFGRPRTANFHRRQTLSPSRGGARGATQGPMGAGGVSGASDNVCRPRTSDVYAHVHSCFPTSRGHHPDPFSEPRLAVTTREGPRGP